MVKDESQTVLIVLTKGLFIRNILRGGVADHLLSMGCRVVILTHKNYQAYIEKTWPQFTVEVIPAVIKSRLHEFWYAIFSRQGLFSTADQLVTSRLKMQYIRSQHFLTPSFLLPYILIRFKNSRKWLENLEMSRGTPKIIKKIFDQYLPSVVFSTTTLADPNDVEVIREAKQRDIKVICQIASWDNLTTKGFFYIRPDYIITWGGSNKLEALKYHHFKDSQVFIAGAPQFDVYFDKNNFSSREQFCQKVGLNSSHPILLYPTRTSAQAQCEPEILDWLLDKIKSNRLPKDLQNHLPKYGIQ